MQIDDEEEVALRQLFGATIARDLPAVERAHAELEALNYPSVIKLLHYIAAGAVMVRARKKSLLTPQESDALGAEIYNHFNTRSAVPLDPEPLHKLMRSFAGERPDVKISDSDDFTWSALVTSYLLETSGQLWTHHLDRILAAIERQAPKPPAPQPDAASAGQSPESG